MWQSASAAVLEVLSDYSATAVYAMQGVRDAASAKSISAPVLLIFADADSMTGEHIVSMYRVFGGFQQDASFDGSLRSSAQLAILPGRTHYNIMEAGEVAELVESFLKQV